MRDRRLGASGLRVSVLTMGTMTFGGEGGFARLLSGRDEPRAATRTSCTTSWRSW